MSHKNHAAPGMQILWLTPGDDVKALVEGITDSGIAKPYVVILNAGVYSIGNNTITVPTYVTIKGQGSAILDFTGNTTAKALILSQQAVLEGIAIQNHLSSEYAIDCDQAYTNILTDVTFVNVSRCVLLDNTSANVTIRRGTFLPVSSAMTVGAKVEQGSLVVEDIRTGAAQAITDLLWATGSNSKISGSRVYTANPNVGNAVRSSAGASAELQVLTIKNATKGIFVESAGAFIGATADVQSCTYGLDVTGTDSALTAFAMYLLNNTTANVRAAAGTVVKGTGLSSSINFDVDPGADFQASFLDIVENDEALANIAELHVGTARFPKESCFGGGDSYVGGMLVYTYDGSSYVDVTTAAQSPSGSTFTYPNNNVNSAIYCGSEILLPTSDYHQFFGIKFLSTVAQSGGTIVAEYWNGSAWTAFNTMTVQSGGKYYRKADQLFAVTAGSYQTRFAPEIASDWTKNDPMTLGTNYYWIRFRISSGLTTAPTFQQFKLHTDRAELNADGFREMFGLARAYRGINVPWNSFGEAGGSMADQDLWLTTNCRSGFSENNFNSDGDTIGTVLTIPSWVDTSAPVRVRAVLVPSTTGTLQMIAWLNKSADGDAISTTDPSSTTGEQSDTISKSVTAGQQVTYEFELDISAYGVEADGVSPDVLWLNLEADSRPGNVYGMLFQVELLQHIEGGHL